jgi:hypothetical protein
MSKARYMHRQICESAARGSASHAWIALLRMIEACARSSGRRFGEVRAELERHAPLGARPALPAIVHAAARLLASHEAELVERAALVAARRRDKQGGARDPRAHAELLARERRIAANPRVKVGCWGWWRRAQDGSGPGVSGPLGGSSGLAM